MEKIENILKKLWKYKPSDEFKEDSRRRIMSFIQSEWQSKIIAFLKSIPKPRISLYLRHIVRERLLNYIQRKTIFDYISELFNVIPFKWTIASTLIASFFFVFVVWVNYTSAEVESRIILVKWSAEIKNLWGQWEAISNSRPLTIWDKIRTWKDWLVEIYYYDNSVTRIAANSEISVSSLTTDHYHSIPTILKIESWRIWNQILSQDHNFQVETWDAFVKTNNWVFDINKNWVTEIAAISQPLDVKIIWNQDVQFSRKIWAWFKIKTDNNKVQKLSDDSWQSQNKKADSAHKENLLQSIVRWANEDVNILPSSIMYFAKKGLESLASDSNPTLIIKRLQELKILILNKNTDLIDSNQAIISWLMASLTTSEKNEVLKFINREFKRVSLFLPWNALYDYKIYISDLAIQLDTDWKFRSIVAKMRLDEAQEVASTLHDSWKLLVVLNEFKEVESSSPQENSAWNLRNILSEKNDHLFMLQSIANSVEGSEAKDEVQEEQKKIAQDIKEIVKNLSQYQNPNRNLDNSNSVRQFAQTISTYLDRINKYETPNWRKNTLHWILNEIPSNNDSLELLYSLREKVDPSLSIAISKKILDILRNNQ